jgi:hypothetical protein
VTAPRRALLAAAALLAGAAAPAAAQLAMRPRPALDDPRAPRAVIHRDTAFVDAIVRLDVEGGPSDVIPALVRDSVLLLPVRQFFDLVGIRMVSFVLRDSAVAMLEPGSVPLRFRPADHTLVLGAEAVAHDSLDVTWWDGDLFVTTALLDRLIGVQTQVDWTNLTVFVANAAHVPVVARARRERRHQNLQARERPAPEVLDLRLHTRPVDGAVLSWAFTASSNGPVDARALEFGLGAGLLGGSAEVRPVFWSSAGDAGTDLHLSWSRVWSDRRWIRQAYAGDVHTGGRRAMLMSGVAVSNAPFIRSSEFDVEQYVSDVPAGWEVEVYENGRLSAYGGADALGTFRVPLELRYGQNPFELVLYGPGGETVRQKRTIRVPFSRLPAGRFEYAAAAGACRYDPCDALVSADARYGLSSAVTLQGGWDGFFGYDGDRTLWQPYALVSAAPHPAFLLTGELVGNGHARGAVAYEPVLDLRVNAAHTRFARSATVAGAAFTAASTEGALYWRPAWRNGASYLQGALVHTTGPGQRRTLARVAGTLRVRDVRYSAGFLHEDARFGTWDRDRFTVDASADAILHGPWRWLRAATAQGALAVDPGTGLSSWRAALGRPVGRYFRVDGGLAWLRGTGVSLELAFSSATPGPRWGTRTRMDPGTGTDALVYANGAVAYDPRTRLTRLGDQSDLGRAGLNGILYRDDNSNGRRDPGEPGLAGVPVSVGGWPARTDAQGRFAAWGLPAGEVADVLVDSLGLGDPQYVLPAQVLRVRPLPNSFGTIEVPVQIGAEVAGYVVFRERPVPGIPVILREMNTGAEIRVTTFGDGGFYKGAVPPGEYEVTIPDELLERLGAFAPPLSIFVPPGTAEKRFSDLHLRLEPRQ